VRSVREGRKSVIGMAWCWIRFCVHEELNSLRERRKVTAICLVPNRAQVICFEPHRMIELAAETRRDE